MSGKDQERFEDYLELERYIEQLQGGYVAHPPAFLTLDQVRIYLMIMLFRSILPEGTEPRPEFVIALWVRLEQGLPRLQKRRSPSSS